ncbi:uncharacterized protein G2W53_003950 [Senna tora]|uniref:Uncharacterized protein n=1 Tax=Senna tora TaxID=362788 RepID=A0A835CJQ7_9FABA|nr:uncharacterized protein G2W53_003950 [Senna tora]
MLALEAIKLIRSLRIYGSHRYLKKKKTPKQRGGKQGRPRPPSKGNYGPRSQGVATPKSWGRDPRGPTYF